jgi:hypothetical protein
LGPFLFVWCERRFGRTLWFDKTRQRFEQAIRVFLRMAQPEGFKSPLGELNYQLRQRFEQAIRVFLRMAQPVGFKSPLGCFNLSLLCETRLINITPVARLVFFICMLDSGGWKSTWKCFGATVGNVGVR